MARIDAVDFANYTTIPTQTQVQCLVGHGVKRVIVGASYGNRARLQLESVHKYAPEMQLEIYAWITHPVNTNLIVRALDVAKGLPIKKIWLDAEAPTNGRTAEQVVQDIRDAINFTKAVRPDLEIGIYTGRWWWIPYTHNYRGKDICSYDLWMANYREPTQDWIDNPTGLILGVGGWTLKELDLWQYAGTVQCCNLNTDLNIELPRSKRMYTDAQLDARFQAHLKAIGGCLQTITQHGVWITENRGLIKELGRGFADHVINHNGAANEEQQKKIQAVLDNIDAALADLGTKLQNAAAEILKDTVEEAIEDTTDEDSGN